MIPTQSYAQTVTVGSFGDLLASASDHFQSNQPWLAKQICEQILAMEPDNDEAHMLLASVYLGLGSVPLARECYRSAASIRPYSAVGLMAKGLDHRFAGDLDEAICAFRLALALEPDEAPLWTLLGATLQAAKRFDEARQCDLQIERINARAQSCREHVSRPQGFIGGKQRVRGNSHSVDELIRAAKALNVAGKYTKALQTFSHVAAMRPRSVAALTGAGESLLKLNRLAEAIGYFRKALAVDEDHAPTLTSLCIACIDSGMHADAERHARRLTEIRPSEACGYLQLGIALLPQNRREEAEQCFRKALEVDPKEADAHLHLGFMALWRGDIEAATSLYELGLDLRPANAEARRNLGYLYLMQGRYPEGWECAEARLRLEGITLPKTARPRWDGQDVRGKTIVVVTEQGLGDLIQFVRYIPLLKSMGATVKFICARPELDELFDDADCADMWVSTDVNDSNQIGAFDMYTMLLSLPRILDTRLDTIPSSASYFTANPERVWRFTERLSFCRELKVGIVWAGGAGFHSDAARSCHVSQFGPLSDVPGVKLFSLQLGEKPLAQLDSLAPDQRPIELLDIEAPSLAETAAAIMALDLVISVDTAVAHLAGALGKSVWTLIPDPCDWRWLREREDTPWYPSMRLFRQPEEGDWTTVFTNVTAALHTLASDHRERRI